MDAGLENVIAAETVLSDPDGHNGCLTIRGHAVQALADSAAFEDVLHLLWLGFFDDLPEPARLRTRLGLGREAAFAQLTPSFVLLAGRPHVEALRTALSLVSDGDGLDTALDLAAMAVVATAATARIQAGLAPILPDRETSHADDFLRMVTGETQTAGTVKAMNAYWATVSDHGLNASTFAARVVASTRPGLVSAVLAGLGALKGPLHGGAPGPVLDMLDAIGAPDRAEGWIRAALDRGDRLMGFGHRIYRSRDPRADALKRAAADLPRSRGRLAFAETIERDILGVLAAEKPDRALETNVEYYTAVLLEALAVPRSAFTNVFACARTAGWIAHAREQVATGRMIRPQSIYVGPRPGTEHRSAS